jgi:hypothetical protein
MTRAGTAAVLVASCVALGASAAILHARDAQFPRSESQERLMYLRSGRAAERVMLSFDSVAADAYWIRAIQHYGRDRRAAHAQPRTGHEFELLQPLLDLTTSLDPRFNIAYRFGAIFLALPFPDGPGRVDQAIALLEKGLARTPNRWQYALDIGYLHYWYGHSRDAAAWLARAAAMPNAPPWIQPIAAATLAQGGDRNGARQLLREQQKSEEKWIREAAGHRLRQLDAFDMLDKLRELVDAFYKSQHRYPAGPQELVQAGLLQTPGVLDPAGAPFEYDTQSNSFRLSEKSPLWPLPEVFARR